MERQLAAAPLDMDGRVLPFTLTNTKISKTNKWIREQTREEGTMSTIMIIKRDKLNMARHVSHKTDGKCSTSMEVWTLYTGKINSRRQDNRWRANWGNDQVDITVHKTGNDGVYSIE